MAADGTIAITLEVNPEDANAGLNLVNKALEGFAKQAKESGKDFSEMIGDVDAAAKQLSKQTGASFKETKKAISDFQKKTTADTKRLAKEQQKAAKEMAKANGSNIVGIETLSDKTGEFDSAIKGAASGVDLFSKSAGKNLWFLGEMAGGIEGGARLTKLFGGAASKLALPLGIMGVAAVGVGAAIFGMGKKARGATVDMEALADALEAARTSALSVEGVKLEIAVQQGEMEQLEADFMKIEEQVKQSYKGRLDQTDAFFKEHIDLVDKLTKKEIDLENKYDKARAAQRFDIGKQIDATSKKRKAAVKDLEAEQAAFSKGAKAWRKVRADMEEEIKLRKRLNQLFQIDKSNKEDDDDAEERRARRKARKDKADAEALKVQQKRIRVADMLAQSQGALAVAERQYAKEIEEITRLDADLGLSSEKTAELILGAYKKRTDAIEAAETKTEESTEKIREMTQKEADALVQLQQSTTDKIAAEYKERTDQLTTALDLNLITIEEFNAKEKELREQHNADMMTAEVKAIQDRMKLVGDFSNQLGDLTAAGIEQTLQGIEQEEKAALARAGDDLEAQEQIRKEYEARRKTELAGAFKLQKGVEIASAMMSGASAAIGALAPPPTGLGPNAAGLAMAALVAATTGTQVATIAAQQPAFHQGGIVGGIGDQQITAQGGEVVLNREAVAALGGAASANSLNAGGGSGGAVVVQMTYKQRVFDAVVADNIAKGGPLRSALNRSARAGRRGRIGGLL
jgi:hypothetical protein